MQKVLIVFTIILIINVILPSDSSVQAAKNPAGPPFRPGEVVVAGAPGVHLAGLQVLKYLPNANITVVKVDKGREFGTVQRFRNHGRKASPNYTAYAMYVPDDQHYTYQWNFTAVRGEEAWNRISGFGVIVAVLDTGIATGGNDGIGCIVTPRDVVNDDYSPDDGDGHGTHVSGTVAQATGNGIGVTGLAHSACIMPVKVLDDNGEGSFSDIADGIFYAVDNGAKVINMSLGTDARDRLHNIPFMDGALDYAYQNNVTVVCSSGNDGFPQNVSYPAIYPTTIAVGATDFNNSVPLYSNRGEGLDLVAPGGDITKDLNHDGYPDGILQETLINGSWSYYFYQGTSMAAPHVAAVAAMLLEDDPTLTPDLIYQIVTSTALDLNAAGYDTVSGYGLIQAYTDVDGDEMADSWEISRGLNPGDPADAYDDYDADGLMNIEEYNLGSDVQDPDSDDDGYLDGFDGYPLDDQLYFCSALLKKTNNYEIFPTIQEAIDDPDTGDMERIQIAAAKFEEDLIYTRNFALFLSGGYNCSYSDNPLTTSINSLRIRSGTIIADKIVIQ